MENFEDSPWIYWFAKYLTHLPLLLYLMILIDFILGQKLKIQAKLSTNHSPTSVKLPTSWWMMYLSRPNAASPYVLFLFSFREYSSEFFASRIRCRWNGSKHLSTRGNFVEIFRKHQLNCIWWMFTSFLTAVPLEQGSAAPNHNCGEAAQACANLAHTNSKALMQ